MSRKVTTDEEGILQTAAALLKGGVVIIPTETVYGIAGSIDHENAIKKIYELKGREETKPLSIFVKNVDALDDVFELTPDEKMTIARIAEVFWPGPLTIVAKKQQAIPVEVTAGKETVGVRVPDDEFSLALLEKIKRPIAVTSANVSGEAPAVSYEEASGIFNGKADLLVDGGKAPLHIPSTVIEIKGTGFSILREGTITEEDINRVIS